MTTPDEDHDLHHDLSVLLPKPATHGPTLEERQRIEARVDLLVRRDNLTRQRRESLLGLAAPTLVVASVAAIAVWSALLVGGAGSPDPVLNRARPIAAAPEAVAVLDLASRAASTSGAAGSPVGDDQFAYTRSTVISNEDGYGSGPVLGTPHEREIWISQNPGSVEEIGVIREFGQDWPMDAGVPAPPSVVRPTYEWLDSLPTDPDDLLTEIESDIAIGDSLGESDQVVFNRIGTLVTEGLVPPETTAALFEAVTRIPGVSIDPNATDALGRSGVGVTRSDDTIRSVWVFDLDTYQVLGTRDYFVMPGVDILIGASAVLERGVVNRVGESPAGPST